MSDYSILVKALLDLKSLDAELKKPRNISLKISSTDITRLNNQADTLVNRLNKIKIANTDAFKNDNIVSQYNNMMKLSESVRSGTTSYQKANVEFGRFSNEVLKVNEAIRTTTKSSDNFGTAMNKALSKIAMWGVATSLVYGSLKQLKEGIQYIKDLNKVMTDTQIVAGYTDAQIASLSSQYTGLAKELGATTLEVANGALEWQRQGKTVEETQKLLRASVMMAKLANMDQAASTEALTSIINGYKLSIDEVIPTIDKLISLDNNFATSTQEIADALTKVSAVSKQSNVSLEEMAAMITVVSSDTRIAAESVGQAWKTVLMRLQNVKIGKFLSEEGEDISDVEKVLTSLGVKLRSDNNTWRDFSDVLKDTMGLWNQLAIEGKTVEQSMIANAFAGKLLPEYTVMYWDSIKIPEDDYIG